MTQDFSTAAVKWAMSELSEHRFLELKATGDLPSPTGVALNVLEQLQNKSVSCTAITSSIQADPALAGRLLKLANSFSGGDNGARPTVSLQETIAKVGPGVTRHITLGLSVLSTNRDGQCDAFDYDDFWSFSLAMGIATELLSERDQLFPKDEAFTVGLLSNIGRMALANVYPEQYTKILQASVDQPITVLLAEERKQLNTDHLEMAHALLKDWGLPRVHHDAIPGMYDLSLLNNRNNRTQALSSYLNLASRIATICLRDLAQDSAMVTAVYDQANTLGISAAEVKDLINQTRINWLEWRDMLHVNSNDAANLSSTEDEDYIDLEQTQDQPLRILIADDDPDTTTLLQRHLTLAGHLVTTTHSGKQAMRMALEERPHCVISDWLMPEMNGIDLCKQLRETRVGQKMYFIILTAHTKEEHLISAFKAGVDDFIEKPLKPSVLLARIRGGQRLFQLQQMIENEQKANSRIMQELAVANQHLEQAALSDALTGIPNRRYATTRLEQEWADADRALTPLCCLLIDVDHFKSVNDTYGHDVGDRVLCEVAQTLRTAARAGDVVCRIGGEEFLVICANTTAQDAESTAERLRQATEKMVLTELNNERNITISIGIAIRDEQDTSVNDLLKAADQAVYLAKANGRNRVEISTQRQTRQVDSMNSQVSASLPPLPLPPQPKDVTDLA